MVEQKITELEDKLEKMYTWAKSEFERLNDTITELENSIDEDLQTLATAIDKPKPKNNKPSNLWSDEEKSFLTQKLTGCKTPRPVLISLVEKWEDKFGRARSYDSLRKMWARLK